MLFQQRIEKSFSNDQGIFDLVGDARRERAEAGKAIKLAEVLFDSRNRSQIAEKHQHWRATFPSGQRKRLQIQTNVADSTRDQFDLALNHRRAARPSE